MEPRRLAGMRSLSSQSPARADPLITVLLEVQLVALLEEAKSRIGCGDAIERSAATEP